MTHSRTKAIHAGTRRSGYGELSEAMFMTQGFHYPSAEAAEARFTDLGADEYIYARYGNPTVAMFQDRIAALEGAEAGFATASGMAAVNAALFSMLKAGDHVVSSRALFGSCLYIVDTLLPRFGVEVTLVDGRDLSAWQAAIRPDTAAVFFESLSNPCLEMVDIKGVSELAHQVGAVVICDNVFATPTLSDAIGQGADLVVYSATKHIDGQGRVLGGVVLGRQELIANTVEPYLKHTGGAMSPFTAWLLLKSLETMELRVREQTRTAQHLAQALQDRTRVIYPGLDSYAQADLARRQMTGGGTMLTLDLDSKDAAFRLLNALTIWSISNNLGDAKSIATHPATTTHQRLGADQRAQLGIGDGVVRLSCGLEDAEDLLNDLLSGL